MIDTSALKLCQAVTANGIAIVKLPSHNHYVLIDDHTREVTRLHVDRGNPYRDQSFTIDSAYMHMIYKVHQKPRYLDYYQLKEGEVAPLLDRDGYDVIRLSIDHYNKIREEARNMEGVSVDEDGDFSFADIDTEYAYKKKIEPLRKYEPVYDEPDPEYEHVEIECVGNIQDPDSNFIWTALAHGTAKFTNGLYKVMLSEIVKDETIKFLDRHNLKEETEIPNHGNVKFIKYKGDFVMYDFGRGVDKGESMICMDVEGARQVEAEKRESVRNHLRIKVFKDQYVVSEFMTMSYLLSKIQRLDRTIRELDVKKNSLICHRTLLKMISDLRNEIDEELKEKGDDS